MKREKYKAIARHIREMFEKEFGRFDIEDLRSVMKELGYGIFENKVDFNKFYEDLSDEERRLVDFMMGL